MAIPNALTNCAKPLATIHTTPKSPTRRPPVPNAGEKVEKAIIRFRFKLGAVYYNEELYTDEVSAAEGLWNSVQHHHFDKSLASLADCVEVIKRAVKDSTCTLMNSNKTCPFFEHIFIDQIARKSM